jgi:hypothetical protein
MMLSNTIPQGKIGGQYIVKAPEAVMGATTPMIIGTQGSYGSVLKRRRTRVFIETPSRRAGEMELYITYRDMNKVVLPETVFVFSTEVAPTTAKAKKADK